MRLLERDKVAVLAVLLVLGLALGHLRAGAAAQVERAYNTENLVRLHVVANSDSEEDQALKLKVRDAVMGALAPALRGAGDAREALRLMEERLAEMERLAVDVLRRHGKDYPARVSLGRYSFPARTYGDVTLPAGRYQALRVVLGEGRGRNWWCVAFPPLCFNDVTGAGAGSGISRQDLRRLAEAAAAGDGESGLTLLLEDRFRDAVPQVRFALVEWWHRAGRGALLAISRLAAATGR